MSAGANTNNADALPAKIKEVLQSLQSMNLPFSLDIHEREYNIRIIGGAVTSIAQTTRSSQIGTLGGLWNQNPAATVGEVKEENNNVVNQQTAADSTSNVPKKRFRSRLEDSSESEAEDVKNLPLPFPFIKRPKQDSDGEEEAATTSQNLDDISCGSSLSTVTSDDEKNFSPWKYAPLREKRILKHKQTKLSLRLAAKAVKNEKLEDEKPVKLDASIKPKIKGQRRQLKPKQHYVNKRKLSKAQREKRRNSKQFVEDSEA